MPCFLFSCTLLIKTLIAPGICCGSLTPLPLLYCWATFSCSIAWRGRGSRTFRILSRRLPPMAYFSWMVCIGNLIWGSFSVFSRANPPSSSSEISLLLAYLMLLLGVSLFCLRSRPSMGPPLLSLSTLLFVFWKVLLRNPNMSFALSNDW